MNRAEKINKLASLLSGKFTAADLKPRHRCIMIGWSLEADGSVNGEDHNVYLVDGKTVTRDLWNDAMDFNKTDEYKVTVSYGN
ncbi:hypothetical protein ACVWYG_000725 [Pedobacter sp. UYEF25]